MNAICKRLPLTTHPPCAQDPRRTLDTHAPIPIRLHSRLCELRAITGLLAGLLPASRPRSLDECQPASSCVTGWRLAATGPDYASADSSDGPGFSLSTNEHRRSDGDRFDRFDRSIQWVLVGRGGSDSLLRAFRLLSELVERGCPPVRRLPGRNWRARGIRRRACRAGPLRRGGQRHRWRCVQAVSPPQHV